MVSDVTFCVTEAEKRRLDDFLKALRTPCKVEMASKSSFNSPEFEAEFRSRLLTQHCFVGTPLFQESFDSAFMAACRQAGHEVRSAPSGLRFWDVSINGRKISLKSTKAKNIRMNVLHISKLTEAAWIQDCRTSTMRRNRTLELFREYCSEVDAIIQLRYFAGLRMYELVEIPVESVFGQVMALNKAQFAADGPTINIPPNKNVPDFALKLDRSDAKITIANINKAICLVHGSWQLEV